MVPWVWVNWVNSGVELQGSKGSGTIATWVEVVGWAKWMIPLPDGVGGSCSFKVGVDDQYNRMDIYLDSVRHGSRCLHPNACAKAMVSVV
jgi:hypothetical protein